MTKRGKEILLATFALLLALAVVGCGGSGSANDMQSPAGSMAATEDYYESYEEENAVEDGTADAGGSAAKLEAPEKMVYSAEISLQSRDYDRASEELDQRLTSAGAIVFGDNKWQNEWSDRVTHTRQLTVRVAAENLKGFIASLEGIESAKVTSSNIHASDRTKQYNDSENRIQLLQQEYDFYEETVRETTDPETRLVYTDRMFELLDEIKQLENTKASIDQDVAYSVVDITLSEDTSLTERNGSVGLGQQIIDALALVPQNIAAAFGYVLLFLIEALPALIILGIVAFLIYRLVRRIRTKRRAKRAEKAAQAHAEPARPPVPAEVDKTNDQDAE